MHCRMHVYKFHRARKAVLMISVILVSLRKLGVSFLVFFFQYSDVTVWVYFCVYA